MKSTWHIFKREVSAYFVSPIAYAVLGVFFILAGLLFWSMYQWYVTSSFGSFQDPYFTGRLNLAADLVRPVFANISVILLFLIPALTMRTFAEEKRSRTIELLLTYPVRDIEVILGKYFAALFFFGIMTVLTVIYPILIFLSGSPEIGPIITSYLGFFLMGATFISIGVFASSTTENQIIAALIGFGGNLFFWIIGWMTPANNGLLARILQNVSIVDHYDSLTQGILNTKDISYFVLLTILFLFLTSRVLLSKKWRS